MMDTPPASPKVAAAAAPERSRTWLRALPLAIFAAIALVFAFALRSGDPTKLPSALIGRPAPELSLPPLEGLMANGVAVPGLQRADLMTGKPVVVNFWASWCAPCVAEHPLLIELVRETGVTLVGINNKDQAANARRFLGRYGNPFTRVGVDASGRAAIDWGVYGMPETFVLDGEGRIRYKHIGPITEESLKALVIPAVRAAASAR
ncbi:MAG: DsbE family thiol:disulfide interchange protein [Hyphomicrobiales bacterium]|nr:DsbE family thiol:disulfide interchange protein [Hyphomicrobiales bacterium]